MTVTTRLSASQRPEQGTQVSSRSLVERAQAGDAEAFGQLYDRYVEVVYRFVYVRVRHRELAEDLTQDTFLRALRGIGRFTWQGRDPGAWLITIARNAVADYYKSGRYRLEHQVAMTAGDVWHVERQDRSPEGDPETTVVDSTVNLALLRAVAELNPKQRTCIVLRFVHGLSLAETAQAMSCAEGAVKSLQHRAVHTLARLLPAGAVMAA